MTGTHPTSSGIAIENRQLVIDGEPFLVLGGELHNSSSSTRLDLEPRLDRVKALGLNTVLAAISWELIEPEEGVFDFSSVDMLLELARSRDLKVVPLWFASWKNGLSSYRPAWVKRDPGRFPLVEGADGKRVQVLSVFSEANRDADAKAFGELMAHIARTDSEHKTVIMVQLENEVGILGVSRDHGEDARRVYESPVEQGFLEHLQENSLLLKPSIAAAIRRAGGEGGGTWAEVFGDSLDTDELFQALGYARYIDRVAEVGRQAYDVPMFVNTWLDALFERKESNFAPLGGQFPGNYPSGGPLPQVFAAWKYGGPHISMLTPDTYWGDFADWCRLYSEANEGFFIPEMGKSTAGIASIHVAIGRYGAIGTSPFGVDGIDDEYSPEDKELLRGAYTALGNASDHILHAQKRGEIIGFHLTEDRTEVTADFGGYRLRITRDLDNGRMGILPDAWGIVGIDKDGSYFGTGAGFMVVFESHDEGKTGAVEYMHSGLYRDGEWVTEQVLNGDESISGEFWRFPYLKPVPGASFGETWPTPRILRAGAYEY